MRRAIFLWCVALAGGAGFGWLTAPSAGAPETAPASAWTSPMHAGAGARRARERLAQLVPTEISDDTLEAPPPPDIAILFRHDLTAIERRPEGAIAWIVDFTEEFGRRGLKVGDVYQDGWRVSAISAQSIELRRRSEVRRVGVFEAPQENLP